jgi:Protein of unknown function (DUF3179)
MDINLGSSLGRPILILSGIVLLTAAACGDAATPDDEPEQVDSPEASATPRIPDVEGWSTNWSRTTIDTSDLIRGIQASDPRDTIPPIDAPKYEPPDSASNWLDDREPVAVLEMNGVARAYPLQILTWHEIVNDELGGMPVVVTYCPLCNTALAFDRRVDGRLLTFGTSGLLRNSDLVMWDRQTESLWQQATGEAIVGEFAGVTLEYLPVTLVSWKDFREAFPGGTVLSRDTGFSRSYGSNPYEFYDASDSPFLFRGEIDDRYPAMERIVGVLIGDDVKGYPFSVIEGERAVNDLVGGETIAVFWGAPDTTSALSDPQIKEGKSVGAGIAYSRSLDGRTLTFRPEGDLFRDAETSSTWNILGHAVEGPLAGAQLSPVVHANHFWFAWAAFYPDAPIYEG